MDNTNKPADPTTPVTTDSTSAAPPPITGVSMNTAPAIPPEEKNKVADPAPAQNAAEPKETPSTPDSATGSLADLGSAMSKDVPAPTTPVSTEPVMPSTAGSSVSAMPSDPVPAADTTNEAHAGMTPPPVTPPVATAESGIADPGYAKTKSNHMVLIIVILVIVAFVSVLVLFFYRQFSTLMNPSANNISPTPAARAVVSPTAIPSPTPVNDEEKELQSMQLDDIDTALKDIDKDLTQL